MTKKRNLPFLLLLTAVFLAGAAGHLLLRTPPAREQEMQVTLLVEEVNGYLAASLPAAGTEVTLLSRTGTLTAVARKDRTLVGRDGDATVTRPATLSFALLLTVRLTAHEKEGRLYVGERMLLVGETVPLYGENLLFSARLTAFEPIF